MGMLLTENQTHFWGIFWGAVLAFVGYTGILFDTNTSRKMVLVFIPAALAALNFPTLSDDIYRFYWDGHCILNGINPFAYTPQQLMELHAFPWMDQFPNLNSPEYFSVYPSVNQALFAISALFGGGIRVFSLVYGILFLLGYSLLFSGLQKPVWKKCRWIILANPLLLVEGLGNFHAEILVLAGIIWAINFWNQGHDFWAFFTFFITVAIKLIPALFVPILLFQFWRNKSFWSAALLGLIILFIPWVNGTYFLHFLSSFTLYIKVFEFYAWAYIPLKEIGQWCYGYNPIKTLGPILSLISVVLVLLFSWKRIGRKGSKAIGLTGLLILSAYFFFTPIFHPWYFIYFLIPAALLQRPSIILVSFLVFLSYHFYQDNAVNWLVWASQIGVIVGAIMIERRVLSRE